MCKCIRKKAKEESVEEEATEDQEVKDIIEGEKSIQEKNDELNQDLSGKLAADAAKTVIDDVKARDKKGSDEYLDKMSGSKE
mgnify:CR=1 FL=1